MLPILHRRPDAAASNPARRSDDHPERRSQSEYRRRMDSEPGWVRVIRAFLEERDDADAELNLVARVSDLKGIRSTLTWGNWVFSALRDTKTRTVLVPESLHDLESRGIREVVWAEAKARGMSIKVGAWV
jgi:hypothetical protein